MLIDKVCRDLNIKQIFFESIRSLLPYPKNYLIPFLQDKIFMNRFITTNKFSKLKFDKVIQNWSKDVELRKNKTYHRIYHIDEFWFSRNFYISAIVSFLYYSYDFLRQIIGLNKKKEIATYSVFTHLRKCISNANS